MDAKIFTLDTKLNFKAKICKFSISQLNVEKKLIKIRWEKLKTYVNKTNKKECFRGKISEVLKQMSE